MNKNNSKLVWSDDPKDRLRLQNDNSKKPSKAPNATKEFIESKMWVAVFRIEKGGRGGKTVTVIDQLPRNELFLKDLCKELKAKCGSGGTFTMDGKDGSGLIEIQGDQRAAVKIIFDKKQIKYKGM